MVPTIVWHGPPTGLKMRGSRPWHRMAGYGERMVPMAVCGLFMNPRGEISMRKVPAGDERCSRCWA